MIKAVIFDMDGLMFDTERIAVKGWEYASDILKYNIPSDIIMKLRGRNVESSKKIFKEAFGDTVDYDKAKILKGEYVKKYIDSHGVPVKVGLFELLEYLKNNDYKIALATSTVSDTAVWYLKIAGVYKYFDEFVFGNEIQNGKPEPDIFIKACEKLMLNSNECIVFEDSPAGIKSAYAAGCHVVMVPDLIQPDNEILKFISYKCENLKEGINIIKSINNSKAD